MEDNQYPQQPNFPYIPQQDMGAEPSQYASEGAIANVLDQIDPRTIIDDFNHALKGEYYNKEQGKWIQSGDGQPLVNDSCRGWIISYLTAIMNKASTLGIISEKQFSGLMEGIIRNVTREFVCNLEKFGFVPPGPGYKRGEYMNRGSPDSSRMDSIAEAIYQRAFLIYSRSINGMESRKLFSSLSMSDPMMFHPQQQQPSWMGRMFGGK